MKRVLLTEDLPDQRALYRDALSDAGYEVLEAENATAALEYFKTQMPDVVVLDIQMPGMDGIEALNKILALRVQTPVILYSAYPSFKANFMTWAADAFVEKTGNPQELVDAVEKVLCKQDLPRPEAISKVPRSKIVEEVNC